VGKLIIMSIIFATVGIPITCSRDPNPVRGVKRMLLLLTVFTAIYIALLVFVYTSVTKLPEFHL
jgi:hypothetical protein